MYLFLDFDGVTHPLGKSDFSSVHYIADVIKKYDDLKIVLSTQWREYSNLDTLKKYFPEEFHCKIIDITPILGIHIPHSRFEEILLYNQEHKIEKNQWVAIDDNSSLFPKYCKNLILISDGKGLNELYAQELEQHLEKIQDLEHKKKNSLKY